MLVIGVRPLHDEVQQEMEQAGFPALSLLEQRVVREGLGHRLGTGIRAPVRLVGDAFPHNPARGGSTREACLFPFPAALHHAMPYPCKAIRRPAPALPTNSCARRTCAVFAVFWTLGLSETEWQNAVRTSSRADGSNHIRCRRDTWNRRHHRGPNDQLAPAGKVLNAGRRQADAADPYRALAARAELDPSCWQRRSTPPTTISGIGRALRNSGFRGSEEDARPLCGALSFPNAESEVEITGDCPVIDPDMVFKLHPGIPLHPGSQRIRRKHDGRRSARPWSRRQVFRAGALHRST